MDYYLPHFEKIDTKHLEEYYRADVVLNGSKLSVDLNFRNQTISEEGIDLVRGFLTRIASFNERNKLFIQEDFDDDGETADHIAFYLDEFDDEELASIVAIRDVTASRGQLLLDALKLIRVGLYPEDNETNFATFDYAIFVDGKPSNQLLVVKTDAQGEVDYITWES